MTCIKAALAVLIYTIATNLAAAAPTAMIAIDFETNEVLLQNNANVRLHPAGITKLMTLYVAFQTIESGEVSIDDAVIISSNAAKVQGVELELRQDTSISLRYLIRAAGVLGANDASLALAEGLDGSEELFAKRMNSASGSLGLTGSTWKNPHGLTERGHMSTANDLARLFIAHAKDFPEYFNLFSRRTTDAGLKEVANSSRRILGSIKGVSGAKYGFTRAAGNSSVTYVERRGKRIVVAVLGEKSSAALTARMSAVIDAAFDKLN
jgi:D-alanyl-D-alanine carboxypeptidase